METFGDGPQGSVRHSPITFTRRYDTVVTSGSPARASERARHLSGNENAAVETQRIP